MWARDRRIVEVGYGLRFADDLNIIVDNEETVVKYIAALIDKAKTVGLIVNEENTKVPNRIIRKRP